MDKKVSIIMPMYNVEKYIKRCLDSILNNTYKNIEVIIIDDCSTDNSLSICKEYAEKDNRIVIIEKSYRSGISETRNMGMRKASGEYLMFVDCDDFVSENFVEKMLTTIEEKNVDIVRCKAIVYNKSGDYTIENLGVHNGKTYIGKQQIEDFAKVLPVYSDKNIRSGTWSLIIRKSKLKDTYIETVLSRTDLIFLVEVLLDSSINSIYFLDEPLYHYCYNEISVTKGVSTCEKYIDGVISSTIEMKKLYEKYNLLDKEFEIGIYNTDINLILDRMSCYSSYPISEIVKVVRKNFNKKDLKEMVKKTKLKNLNTRWKIITIILKLHFYLLIAFFIKIRNKAKN